MLNGLHVCNNKTSCPWERKTAIVVNLCGDGDDGGGKNIVVRVGVKRKSATHLCCAVTFPVKEVKNGKALASPGLHDDVS